MFLKVILSCLLLVSLVGCSAKKDVNLDKSTLEALEKDFKAMTSRPVSNLVKDRPYVSLQAKKEKELPEVLTKPVTLRSKGSLEEVCDTIMELLPIQINLVSENDLKMPEPKASLKIGETPEIARFLDQGQGSLRVDAPKRLNINHSGPLHKLLDQLAAQSGYGWEYEPLTNTITLARTLVKTFVLQTAPGRISFNNQLTNKSKPGTGNLGQKNASENKSEIAQTYQGDLGFDVFKDTLQTVRTMLSPIGRAEGNEGAGTLTVRDRPENLRQIGKYIEDLNKRYSKQVALKVNVYSLEINDQDDLGLDVAAVIPKLNLGPSQVSLAAGALSGGPSLGTATAAILDGHFKGTQGMLTALKKLGKARQITSAGIVALNNQPAPVEAIKRIAYLAGTSVETTDSGSETELTPGEVTTGFSMTITPHILQEGQVVLQYNVQLSTLDALESFETHNTTIQLPQVSSRAFAQKATMLMGQTLLIAGFEQATQTDNLKGGLLSLGKKREYHKSMIIVTIEVADANPKLL